MARNALSVLLLCATGVVPARAQAVAPVDLVPADAAAAIVVRNLEELKAKGDKLWAGAKLEETLRPSQLFAMAYEFLGLQGAVDFKGSAAVVLAKPEQPGEQNGLANLETLLVGVVPIADRDKLAAALGLKATDLHEKRVLQAKVPRNFGRFFYLRGKHLYLGNSDKTVARLANAKSVRGQLSAGRQKAGDEADLLFHLAPKGLGGTWDDVRQSLEKEVGAKGDADEKRTAERFFRALAQVQFIQATARVEEGLGISFASIFPEKGAEDAQRLLADLSASARDCRLDALPAERIVAAHAFAGEGTRTAVLVKSFFEMLLEHDLVTHRILAVADRPLYAGVLGEVWQHLKGTRAGLYQTSDTRFGQFGLLAILDTADAQKFLSDMRLLVRIAAEPETAPLAREGDRVDIGKLVGDLGNPKFRVRESATLKLRLVGEPALPALKKAMKVKDLEAARRAERLWTQIEYAATQRRKELLAKGIPRPLHPRLTFAAKPEKRAGHRVDILRVKLTGEDEPLAKQLQGFLGPDWNRVRLAAHGKQLVVLLGSETGLLEETLGNLADNKPGLGGAKSQVAFRRQALAPRQMEFHVSAQRVLSLVTLPGQGLRGPGEPGPAMTSVGLAVDRNVLQVDVSLPLAEIAALARHRAARGN